MSVNGIVIDLFKWIIGTIVTVLIVAFTYQQSQISTLTGKLDTYKESVYPKLTQIEVSVGKVETSISNIERQLGNAVITK